MPVKAIVPQGKKTRVSGRRNVKARLRAQEAVKLRLAGISHTNIAKQLGYANASGSYKAVMRELRENALALREGMEELREQELQRLETLNQAVWPGVLQRPADMGSVHEALRISESRRDLLGLDAPKQLEARIRLDVVHWNEVLKVFLDAYRDIHGTAPEAGELIARIDQAAQERFG